MTEDQIKAIAEEVAHLRAFDGGHFPHEKEIREDYEVLLQWLNEKYCIVEREKVEQEYVYASGRSDQGGYYDGKAEVLEDLFGTSMFNQDKE